MLRQVFQPARCFSTVVRSRVLPGIVAPSRTVPSHILRPEYAETGTAAVQMSEHVKYPLPTLELLKMKKACTLAAQCLQYAGSLAKVGTTTEDLDAKVHAFVIEQNIYPSPLHYCHFPKSLCSSINEVIVHGIPDDRSLQDGDIVNLDVSVYVDGYHGDTSRTFLVGEVDAAGKRLVAANEEALARAIAICKPGVPLNMIGKVIHEYADEMGYTTVEQFTGHAIGNHFHLLPFILHFRNNEPGIMEKGMIFTIEPMFNEGSLASVMWEDGWTVATKDGGRSAQREHTILITENGAEILTTA